MKPISPFPEGSPTLSAPDGGLASPAATWSYRLFAWSFAWVPTVFFSFCYVTAKLHFPNDLGLLFLWPIGVYLLLATVLVLRSKRKSRWLYAGLNLVALAVALWWLALAATFGGGYYK